jgi:hypothetical protein
MCSSLARDFETIRVPVNRAEIHRDRRHTRQAPARPPRTTSGVEPAPHVAGAAAAVFKSTRTAWLRVDTAKRELRILVDGALMEM